MDWDYVGKIAVFTVGVTQLIKQFVQTKSNRIKVLITVLSGAAGGLLLYYLPQQVFLTVDENPTTEVIKYKPSLNQPLVMYKGEPDYDFAFPRFYNLAVGDKAKCEVLIVFMQESVEKTTGEETSVTGYKAWKNEAALTFSSLNAVDSTLTMDINFGGHVERGYAYPDSETKKPVFVKESTDEEGSG